MNANKLSVRDLCLMSIFIAMIAICAQLAIPMPYGVPMTLQTLAIPLAGIILGSRNGTIAVLVYILLGAVGAPVFAAFTGGLGIVFGPTGGFILSFPLMALAAGIGEEKRGKIWLLSGLVGGAVINYLCGMIYFSFAMSSDLKSAFIACVLPFIPTTVIKIILAAVLGKSIKTALVRNRVAI